MHATDVCVNWLDRILHDKGVLGSAGHVTKTTIEPIGTGLVADSYQIKISYSEGNLGPESLVAKMTSDSEASRAAGRTELNYAREVGFYNEIAPNLQVRVPDCFHAEIDSNNTEFVLLLEDMSPARPGNQLAGCSVAEAKLAIEQAARIHAPYWASDELEGNPWLDISSSYWQRFTEMMPQWYAGFVERYSGRLIDDDVALGQEFVDNIADYYRALSAMPYTIQHGDYRLDNVLFDARGGEVPLVVLDWQTVVYGPGVVDVAYFVGGALDAPTRRMNEDAILHHYHSELAALGVDGYSFEQLLADYACATFHNFIIGVAAAMLVERTERGDELFLSMVTNSLAHARDRDGVRHIGAGALTAVNHA
ncbi:phosphotransferase [Rhodococcus sp. NPDC003318]|uniref:phosphotransferase n=1 Tax=Rhodococcus sp. NPDC003318 TaxID=3364503 RepID=UPI0036766E7E